MLSANDVFHYLGLLGIPITKTRGSQGDWINFSCPLAPWTHEKGRDRSPSFGISLSEISAFNCYTCHHHGTLSDLARLYCDMAGGDPGPAIDYSREVELGAMQSRAERATAARGGDAMGRLWAHRQMRAKLVQDWTLDFPRPRLSVRQISAFDVDPTHHYLVRRGLQERTVRAWGLRIRRDPRGYDRVVFPIYDHEGHLLAHSSRMSWDQPTCPRCDLTGDEVSWGMVPSKDDPPEGGCPACHAFVPPKYLHSKGFMRNLYLYGEHLLDPNHRTGVLVEGNMSPLRLWQLGVRNVVATLGSKLGCELPNSARQEPGQQLYQAGKHFDTMILIPDRDRSGQEWTKTIQSFFEQTSLGRKTTQVVELPQEGTDPADSRVSDEMLRELLAPYNVWQT